MLCWGTGVTGAIDSMLRRSTTRGLSFALLILAAVTGVTFGGAALTADGAYAQGVVVRDIRVVGNRRIEPETVRSYLTFTVGQRYDSYKADESFKALFATGLFQDVKINLQGSTVVVTVVESPIINRVQFEGNKDVKSDTLAGEVQLKPRSIYSRARVQSDVQRILDVYRRQGYYAAQADAQIIELDNNRVDLVFEIREGPETKVVGINFLGNTAFSDSELRGVITTTESSILDFLKPTSVYDPDRFNLDRELLRRYYLKNGYADMRVVSAVADVDREGRGFFLTFTVDEGPLYKFGGIDVQSTLPSLNPAALSGLVMTTSGDVYNADLIDKTVERLTIAVAEQGYAFGQVRPRVERDPVTQTISVVYVVEQGPRVYIDRINIVGNIRTEDYVIRREIRVAEGDAYNKILVDQARQRLIGLGFFKDVKVNREQGAAPDRVILTFAVEEQSTGELSFSVGYSSNEGVIGEVSYTERNFLGKGQYLQVKVSGSFQSGQFDVSWTEPRFLDRNLSFGVDAFVRNTDYTDQAGYQDLKIGGSVRLGFALLDNLWLNTNYTLYQDEVYDVNSAASLAVQQIEGTAVVSSVGYSLIYDTRNNRKNPSRGFYFAFTQDTAGVGGDINYIRSVGEVRAYYPLFKQVTIVGRAIGGNISGWDGQDVRIVDAFFKGGETIRGFETAGIGPRDKSTTDALGGKNFYAGTVEVRFPLPLIPDELGFSGAVFADAGSVFGTDANKFARSYALRKGISNTLVVQDDDSIRSSVGASLLWNSPVGPLRADFAYVITKEDYDKDQFFKFGAATRF
jgi:outer membrane protein insertion porin family